jgi:hypothetical protein
MRIADAIFNLVLKAGAGVLAAHMNMPESTMYKKADIKNTTHFFRPEELVAVQVFANDYSINHAFAEAVGGQFIEPANFAHLSDEALLDLFTSLMQRNGIFAGDFQQAWSDGRITPKEFNQLCSDLYQVKQVCAELQSRMGTMVDERPRPVEKVRPGK